MRFTLALAVAAAAAIPSQAFIAWSGSSCNGDKGAEIGCDGSCHSFAGRHSFSANFDNRCVSLWTSSSCQGQRFNYTHQGLECTNVNTGTDIQSFRCWVGNTGCKA